MMNKEELIFVESLFRLIRLLDPRITSIASEVEELNIYIGTEPFTRREFKRGTPIHDWFVLAESIFQNELYSHDFVYPETNTDKEPIT